MTKLSSDFLPYISTVHPYTSAKERYIPTAAQEREIQHKQKENKSGAKSKRKNKKEEKRGISASAKRRKRRIMEKKG